VPVDRAQVKLHVVGAVGVHAIEERGRERVARSEFVGEPTPGRVKQPGALAAFRLGQQRPVVVCPGARQRGGAKLTELEIGQVGLPDVREYRTGRDRAPRIGGASRHRGPAARGKHGRSRR
jgi:hypothetical protein